DLVDEPQLVGVDRLLAARTVEVARFERELVHEARHESRLIQRREIREMLDLRVDVHTFSLARIIASQTSSCKHVRQTAVLARWTALSPALRPGRNRSVSSP